VFDRGTVVTRTLKMSAVENTPRPRAAEADFDLRASELALMAHLDAIGDGVIGRLEVAHGLPLLVEVCDRAASAPATTL
jgi:hypothetical protein